jgi:uncharacterized membrane protein
VFDMNDLWFHALRIAAALGSGIMCGVFFAFSTAVMPGLARLEPAQGIAAMQSMNRTILNPTFLSLFLLTPALCGLSLWFVLQRGFNSSTAFVVVGSACYLLGAMLVTFFFNVPLNDNLATINPNAPDSLERWQRFSAQWTSWNNIRTLASLTAAALLGIA